MKIILASDIHLRLYARHKEYETVFKRFYKYVDSIKDDDTVICIGGDVVHNKIQMSPELVQMTSNFLRNCADRCPTILILGNHDFIVSQNQRLDALSPIVESLNHPNLHFWKTSGVYKLKGVHFSVFSLLGSPDQWVYADKMKAKHKVALFHGPVLSSHFDNPYIEEGNRALNISKFDGFDVLLLGDIHVSNQTVSLANPVAKYPGSLICQSFGEPALNHGILVWDIPSRTSEFVEIENDYCYYTLEVTDDKYSIPKNLPKKVYLRVKRINSLEETVSNAINDFSKKYEIIELHRHKHSSIDSTTNTNTLLGNSRDVAYQNLLIAEYLKSTDVELQIIDDVQTLNERINKTITNTTIQRNIVWKPLKLEFSNMFSYGENNSFDFEKMSGVYGITAKNFEGKSAFFEILIFAIYDKTTRTSKGIHILNNNKTEFHCKFSFEFNGNIFYIERHGIKNPKTGNVRVDVNFWTIDENGNEHSLTGEDRDQTNKAIREYLGTYDDFVMTALSTQYDNQSFVEKSQRERKELLYKFLDISIFDDLFKLAKDESKEQQILIKDIERENLFDKLSVLNIEIDTASNNVNDLSVQINSNKDELINLTNLLLAANKNIQATKMDADIDYLLKSLKVSETKLEELNNQLIQYNEDKIKYVRVDTEGFVFVKTLETTIQTLESKFKKIEQQIKSKEVELKNHNVNVSHLATHEYDPNCQFCCQNKFVIAANESVKVVPVLTQEISDLQRMLEIVSKNLNEDRVKHKQQLDTLALIEKTEQQLSNITNKIQTIEYQIQVTQTNISSINKDIQQYYDNEQLILENKKWETEISKVRANLSKVEKINDSLQTKHRNEYGNLVSFQKERDLIQQKLNQYTDLVKKNRIYEIYSNALSRDGIPYMILEKVMPVIENEVNNVLTQIVDFTVRLETSEEKYINAYINYGNNQTWPVELTSGMERFILSLAFRTSLSEITSLPRPLFLAIDEGFGVLDSDNLMSMGKMFEFLKTRYNYLMVISHIEQMRDLVEKRIIVQKQNGFSTIQLETT